MPEMTGVEVDGSAARAVSAGETGAEAETACPEEEGTTRQARGQTGISTAKPADEQGSRPRSPRTRDGAEKPSEPSEPLGPWEREMALPKSIQLKSKEEEIYHAPATGALAS